MLCYIASAFFPYFVWRLWNYDAADRAARPWQFPRISYSLSTCLQLVISLAAVGLGIRSFYDQSPLGFFAGAIVLIITIPLLAIKIPIVKSALDM